MSINEILLRFPAGLPAAILFDLDGTLVDSAPDIAAAVDRAMSAEGLAAPGESRVRHWIGNGSLVLIQRALAWASQSSIDALDEALLDEVYSGFLGAYADCNGQRSTLYTGTDRALRYWYDRSVPLAVVTNKPLPFVSPLLCALGIDQYFSLHLGGECVAEKKPSPLPLLTACERLGVAAAACLMVGDSSNDILAARAAPMPVVGVRGGYNHGGSIDQAQPDLIVDTLSELIPP